MTFIGLHQVSHQNYKNLFKNIQLPQIVSHLPNSLSKIITANSHQNPHLTTSINYNRLD